MSRYRVQRDRENPFDHPIKLKKDEIVTCGEAYSENPNWPGWTWCSTESSTGWVPKQIIQRKGSRGVILEDYDATEHDIKAGDVINGSYTLNGWVWGYKEGAPHVLGWAPLDHLEEISDS